MSIKGLIGGIMEFCKYLFVPRWNRHKVVVAVCMMSVSAWAQDYNGTRGLLHVPTGTVSEEGMFRGGVMFLHQEFLPAQMPHKNTMGYVVGVTPCKWLEMSYAAALLYMHKNADKNGPMGYYNEDRRVNVRVTPLYEGKYWPGIAVGMDDVGRFERIRSGDNLNNYFQNVYVAATKHVEVDGWELGGHLAYRYYPSENNKDKRGIAGGVTVRPEWCRQMRMVAEYDGAGVNVGADVLLWRHWFVQAGMVHGRGVMGGVGYHYRIRY